MIKDEPKNVTDVLDLLYKICIRSRCFRERHLLKGPEHRCRGVGHMDSSPHRLSQTQCLSVSPPHPGSRAVLPQSAPIPLQLSKGPLQPLPGSNPNYSEVAIPPLPKENVLSGTYHLCCLSGPNYSTSHFTYPFHVPPPYSY